MASRTLTFESSNLGEDVPFLLCLVPQTDESFAKHAPVAWKVATLAAQGRTTLSVTFTDTPGVCVAQIGPSNIISVGNHMPIRAGQETTVTLGSSTRAHFFSYPNSIGGDVVRITNRTGQPADIGFGCVSGVGQSGSNPPFITSVFRNVQDGELVTADASPIVRAYLGHSYQESQIVGEEIKRSVPVWEADFRSLQQSTTISIARRGDGFLAAYPSGGHTSPLPRVPNAAPIPAPIPAPPPTFHNPTQQTSFSEDGEKIYSAVLAFADAGMVVQGLKCIADNLGIKGYKIKFTSINGGTDALVDLTLPFGTSCDQAENDTNAAIQANSFTSKRACIRSRTGSMFITSNPNYVHWVSINPASPDWYQAQRYPSTPAASKRYFDGSTKQVTRLQIAPYNGSNTAWNSSFGH